MKMKRRILQRDKPVQKRSKDTATRELIKNSIRALDGEGNERKFILSFSSEEPYQRFWGTEILDHSEGAVDLTRIQEIGCLLFNHNRDAVVGKITNAWLEDGRGMAEIEFDTDEASELIYQKVASGTLKGVSVGYQIDSRKWTPYEISIVSVPADPTVGVGREFGEEKNILKNRSLAWFKRQLQINKTRVKQGGKTT